MKNCLGLRLEIVELLQQQSSSGKKLHLETCRRNYINQLEFD